MSDENCCNEHKEHTFRLKKNEDDIQKINNGAWKIIGLAFLNLLALVAFLSKEIFFK
jgi:hypothetical protein